MVWMDIYIYIYFYDWLSTFPGFCQSLNGFQSCYTRSHHCRFPLHRYFWVEISYPRERTTRAFVKYNWRFSKLESPSHTVTPKSSIVGYCCTMLYLYPMKYINYKLLYVLLCIIPPLHPHENPWFDILGQKKLLDHIPSEISPSTSSTYTMNSLFSVK